MSYYEDLSVYNYFRDSVPDGSRAFNIGWLEEGRSYKKGSLPDSFLQSLGVLVRDAQQMKTRGWHRCRLPHQNGAGDYPVTVDVSGSKVVLGGAEIRVVAESGDWLIAPDLIYHYVTDHFYRPPEEFIEAVTARRIAPL